MALSEDGRFLAATTYDGRINVWDVSAGGPGTKIQEYETAGASAAGSFGLCVDLSLDGKYTASGHQSGAVYVFNNQTGRLQYSLPGKSWSRRKRKKGKGKEIKTVFTWLAEKERANGMAQ